MYKLLMALFLSDSPNEESVVCGDDEPVTQDHCCGISSQVGTNWKNVLRKLSLDEIIIQNLEEDHKNDKVVEKCYQGLLEWRKRVGPRNATTKKLCEALRLVGCSEALKTLSTMCKSRKDFKLNNSEC